MSMRWTVCLLTILLGGCQGPSLFERPTVNAPPCIMPFGLSSVFDDPDKALVQGVYRVAKDETVTRLTTTGARY